MAGLFFGRNFCFVICTLVHVGGIRNDEYRQLYGGAVRQALCACLPAPPPYLPRYRHCEPPFGDWIKEKQIALTFSLGTYHCIRGGEAICNNKVPGYGILPYPIVSIIMKKIHFKRLC